MSCDDLCARYPALRSVVTDIQEAFRLLIDSFVAGGKLLACGNGGSAADAEHIVGELMKSFNLRRPLAPPEVAALSAAFPEEGASLAGKLQRTIPAVSLVSQTALMTAIGNDTDPEMIFAQQVLGLGRPGDVLLAISTSGNSRNVIAAAQVARAFQIKVIALTGDAGGRLAPLADVAIRVPARNVPEVQELHLPVYHWLCAALETALFEYDTAAGLGKPAALVASAPKPTVPQPVGLIVFDFDGVFTDNRVYTAQDGTETVVCDRADGLGIDMLRKAGVPMMVLSTETNPVVGARVRKLKLPLEQGCGDKAVWLREHLRRSKIDPKSVIYVGNDLNDLEAMTMSGFSAAPADAHAQVKQIASLVMSCPGGRGAVREFCEFILRKASC